MTKYSIAFSLFALLSANAAADHVYGGLAQGNTDLTNGHVTDSVSGVQPGVGTSFDIYGGLASGNEDLFQRRESDGRSGSRPDIYQAFRGNPDLGY